MQGLILGRLQPQRRLAQEAALQRVGIGRVLQAQRVERPDRRGEPLADDLVEQTAHPLAEHERHVAADEARQLLLHHAADQEELEARREARHQRAVDAGMAVQQVGEPEARAERQLAARRPDVAEAAVDAGAVDDVLDVGQQALEDPARHQAMAEVLEDQLALLGGEREQAERDPVAVGDRVVDGVMAGSPRRCAPRRDASTSAVGVAPMR